jgi:hypothetical protein
MLSPRLYAYQGRQIDFVLEWVIAISLLLNILKMQKILTHKPKAFSNRGVTIDQAIRILRRNGIQVNEDHARIILDFLYLIATTMPKSGLVMEP